MSAAARTHPIPTTRTGRRALILVIVCGVTLPARAASAAPNHFLCFGVPDAGFVDVSPASPHKSDIDCLKASGITGGTTPTTFDPTGTVTRWQMALFITRLIGSDALSGSDQGFEDIAALPTETRLAINRVSQLGITSGTTPTTFAPDDAVTRWQMALFLTRAMRAEGLVLPDGAAQGFTDIAHLPPVQQTAINQLAQMAVTGGTSPTTFAPDVPVTREQMASFIIRTLELTWSLGLAIPDSCTPPIPADPNVPPAPGTVCDGELFYPAGETFTVRQAWFAELPFFDDTEMALFRSPDTRVELVVDGTPVERVERTVALPGVELRYFESVFRGGLTGTHPFDVRWYFAGELIITYRVTITFL